MINFNHLEQLPFREAMKRPYGWRTHDRHSERHSVDHISYWKRVRRNIHNNIGKSFAMAFHYYCTQVPKYQQGLFLDEFANKYIRYRYFNDCYIDEEGNIQKIPSTRLKKTYKVYSDDYRIKWIHKKYKNVIYQRPWAIDNYIQSYDGTVQEFNSRKHPVYVKYARKKYTEYLREDKLRKKLEKQKSLEIFNKSIKDQKDAIKRQRELDILKRDQAGFDENSFTGDVYHGRKKKRYRVPIADGNSGQFR